MEELNTITNDMKETEELFSYIDQCIIELESEDGEMINQPLEVLLILIKKAEIRIEDMFVSKVTEQFLSYVTHLKSKNIEDIGSYLVIAAKILEIKVKAMLPIVDEEDFTAGEYDYYEDEDAMDLVDRLNEYQMFKEASVKLKEQESLDRFFKEPDKSTTETKIVFTDFNIEGLTKAFQDLMLRYTLGEIKPKTIKEIPTEAFSEDKKIRYVSSFLKEKGSCSFFELFERDVTRMELITTFKVVLELIKLQCIGLEQKTIYDDITLTFKREWSEEDGRVD